MSHQGRASAVSVRSVGFTHVPHRCRACGWAGEIGVRGEGYLLRTVLPHEDVAATRKDAASLADRFVVPDARASAALARCPRCKKRDPVAMAALHRSGTWRAVGVALLALGVSACAGGFGWSTWGGIGLVLGGVWAGTVAARLYRADRAVFFVVDDAGNASAP